MSTERVTEHYTYDDYFRWKGDWELIGGAPLAMTPSPTIPHRSIAASLLHQLMNSIGDCEQCLALAEEDWKISDDTVVRPDVVLICNEPNEAYITRAPEIIAEVISPATAKRDEVFKHRLYESEGVKYYILVYPEEHKAKLYQLQAGRYIKEGDFSTETYAFENTHCPASIDFSQVFKRLRK